MANYKKVVVPSLDAEVIDEVYKNLLNNKWHFIILDMNKELNVLTKEKSIFKIESEEDFIKSFEKDVYYKTIITNENIVINEEDLKLYNQYIKKYKNIMEKNIYGYKYIFGSVAVKTDKGFITTIRGKTNLKDYTVVQNVNHTENVVTVINRKATLNAPLLDKLFENKDVKVIVHIIHVYDDNLPFLVYAFAGSNADSIRNIKKSFNIRYHGVIYLFDEKGNLI